MIFGKLFGDGDIQGDHYIQGHYIQVQLYIVEQTQALWDGLQGHIVGSQ